VLKSTFSVLIPKASSSYLTESLSSTEFIITAKESVGGINEIIFLILAPSLVTQVPINLSVEPVVVYLKIIFLALLSYYFISSAENAFDLKSPSFPIAFSFLRAPLTSLALFQVALLSALQVPTNSGKNVPKRYRVEIVADTGCLLDNSYDIISLC